MHGHRFELVREPGKRDRVVGLDVDRSVGVDSQLASERSAVKLAFDLGGETGELAPRGAVCDRVREERGRLGFRFAVLKRPAQGQRGELANLVIRLASERAGLFERLADVNRIAPGADGVQIAVPSGAALIVSSLSSESIRVKTAPGIGLPCRSATRRTRPPEVFPFPFFVACGGIVFEGWLDLEGDFPFGLHPVQLRRDAGHGLGVIAEQERSLVGAGQNSVLAFTDDDQAALGRQSGPQTVRSFMNGQLTKHARLGLGPELGVRHLGDEAGVAGLGLLAEINFSRPTRLGLRSNPDEQEVGPGLTGMAQHDDESRKPRPDPPTQRTTTIHGKSSSWR